MLALLFGIAVGVVILLGIFFIVFIVCDDDDYSEDEKEECEQFVNDMECDFLKTVPKKKRDWDEEQDECGCCDDGDCICICGCDEENYNDRDCNSENCACQTSVELDAPSIQIMEEDDAIRYVHAYREGTIADAIEALESVGKVDNSSCCVNSLPEVEKSDFDNTPVESNYSNDSVSSGSSSSYSSYDSGSSSSYSSYDSGSSSSSCDCGGCGD